jgi:hypothetical protein
MVSDSAHEGKDYILDHPDVEKFFGGAMELPGGIVMHFG